MSNRYKNKRGGGRRKTRRRYYGKSSRHRNNAPSFNPRAFVKKAVPEEYKTEYETKHKFAEFDINPQLKSNIYKKGYKTPTPIQDQAIPALLKGRDVVGVAATGTGKTAAFLIPLINKVINNRQEKVLVVTPTRELAQQVEKEIKEFTKSMNLGSVICIGGVNIKRQINNLRNNPNFVVGTPGRLLDLEKRRKLNFNSFGNIVLDEVDRMLDMGFIKDITFIVSRLRKNRQSLFFSATLPHQAKDVMNRFLNNPITISIKAQAPSENVDQDIVKINGRNKKQVLLELLRKEELEKVLVFGRTKRGIEKLGKELNKRGINVATMHGNKSQGQRRRALEQFRKDKIQVLLATDVASRGLDIDDITHVINYDLPQTYEDYIHRIGRTGRLNKTGVALTFVT
jgi:superfamily II DNA/RNA helicase